MSYQKFLEFQRKHNGALPPSSAAKMLKVSRATIYRLKSCKGVSVMRHNRTLYFGYNSLLEWASLTRTMADWKLQEAKDGI